MLEKYISKSSWVFYFILLIIIYVCCRKYQSGLMKSLALFCINRLRMSTKKLIRGFKEKYKTLKLSWRAQGKP